MNLPDYCKKLTKTVETKFEFFLFLFKKIKNKSSERSSVPFLGARRFIAAS